MTVRQAWSGKKSSLLILLKAGANVHALAVDNMTPLIFAAQNGHAECCESLLKKVNTVSVRGVCSECERCPRNV